MEMIENCLFCKIVKGEVPCSKIYENNNVLAFLDIGPVNKGHTLVVPKKHSKNIFDMEEEELTNVAKAIKTIAPAIKKASNADGLNIMSSNEKAAGQVIMHSHFHIIPRLETDGLKLWPQGKYENKEMEEYKKRIEAELS